MDQRKRWFSMALALLLVCALLPAAALAYDSAYPAQRVSGALKASQLQSGAAITLTGDTVLTLDQEAAVQHLEGETHLTVRGDASLTVADGVEVTALTLESGTLKAPAAKGTPRSGVRAATLAVSGGLLVASDGGDAYGVDVSDCMTVTGGEVSASGCYSGVKARQLLVSGGTVRGTGTGQGGEFDKCDGVFTEVLKVSGGTVEGVGSEAGITMERMYALTEGVGVLVPEGGSLTKEPIRFSAWGGDVDAYETHTVLDAKGAVSKTARLGLPAADFSDVADARYYALPVRWASAGGVTDGVDETHFGPDATCTRAQVVTFLWRAAHQPEPKSADNRFTDVEPSHYFYKAVLWAVEQGITDGVDSTHFDPAGTCTRGHVVTFLYRFEKQPAVEGSNPFSDVPETKYFHDAVLWAVRTGVTDGVTDTSFAPADGCTRAQVVTFLYRDLHRVPKPETLPDDTPV